jgi:hypothetical protein
MNLPHRYSRKISLLLSVDEELAWLTILTGNVATIEEKLTSESDRVTTEKTRVVGRIK